MALEIQILHKNVKSSKTDNFIIKRYWYIKTTISPVVLSTPVSEDLQYISLLELKFPSFFYPADV
jgi:hypothetical protein